MVSIDAWLMCRCAVALLQASIVDLSRSGGSFVRPCSDAVAAGGNCLSSESEKAAKLRDVVNPGSRARKAEMLWAVLNKSQKLGLYEIIKRSTRVLCGNNKQKESINLVKRDNSKWFASCMNPLAALFCPFFFAFVDVTEDAFVFFACGWFVSVLSLLNHLQGFDLLEHFE